MPGKFEKFGSKIPFAEPSWYRGNPTPYYEEKHVNWRKKVRAFVDKEMRPYANEWDESKTFPLQQLRKKAYDAGVLSPAYPVELGGTPPEGGWDHWMNVIWHDELARCGSGGVLIILIGITVMSLPHTLKFGSDFLKETVAKPVIRGEEGVCITLTEPEGGSDLANLTTTAEKTPDGKFYIVNGLKKFITGGMTNRWFSTAVRTGGPGHGGVSLLMIDKQLPGVSTKKLETQGWWAGNTALVIFENVKVPVEYLIGDEGMGFPYLVDVMNGERLVAIIGVIRGCRSLFFISCLFCFLPVFLHFKKIFFFVFY
jgi:alkylation response protein AidB-like acyl-CoA dehydrogenase